MAGTLPGGTPPGPIGAHASGHHGRLLQHQIYISGERTVPQSIAAMKLGAMDFLIKPFTREDLLKAVAAGIEKTVRK